MAAAPSEVEMQPQEATSAPNMDESVDGEARADVRMPGWQLLFTLCAVGALEGADTVMLPCVFFALQVDLGLSLNDLALMTLVQVLAQNLAAPCWGVMADRGIMRRKTLIIVGCVVQGLITVVLAFVDQLGPMIVLRAFNGVMLASLKPIANGVVADVTSECRRGRVFGCMQFAMNAGTMLGTLLGTNLGRRTLAGIQGWRVAFAIVGLGSVAVGLAAALMTEPPREGALERREGDGSGRAAVKTEALRLLSYFRMTSFCVLILQGCFGSVPWNALGYSTLFFQISGIKDFQASIIQVFQQIAGSLGALLGGVVSDRLTRWSRMHGRPITAQISVLAGIPVAWFIFMQAPPESGAFYYYLALMITLGLTATWCGIGVNLPILSELVKPGNRATIMAWEGTLEGSCAAIFGNAMVGFLAQNVFGYNLDSANSDAVSEDPENVKALGKALMLVSFVPWIICFSAYSLLHWSYPRDIKRLQKEQAQEGKVLEVEVPEGGPSKSPAQADAAAQKAASVS